LKLSNYPYILYLVTDTNLEDEELLLKVEQAINGGVNVVQLRDKKRSSLRLLERAQKLKEVTKKYKVPLIINDRLDIALAVNAEGLHIGQKDLPIEICKKHFNGIIGVSANNKAQAEYAYNNGADYIGYGTIYPTNSKDDYVMIEDSIEEVKKCIEIPIIGIGGIKQDHIPKLIDQGLDGVAVISAILSKSDPKHASQEIVEKLTSK
jgi:thiamine-phosphate pyrophosphorylase